MPIGQRSKHHAKKLVKFSILLDEGLPPPRKFLKLNSCHNVKHIKHNFGFEGLKDTEVYKQAIQERRILLVFNTKDFTKLGKVATPSIFCISQNMTTDQIDSKLLSLLKKIKQSQLIGHIFFISQQRIEIRQIKNED